MTNELRKALDSVRGFLEGQCVQPNEQALVRDFDLIERRVMELETLAFRRTVKAVRPIDKYRK